MSSNSDKTIRVATTAAGAALAYYGFKKGGVAGTIVGVVGAGLATSSAAAVAGVAHAREVREVVEVKASPTDAYNMWSCFENFPRFMQNVLEVRKTGERTWRWTVEGPLGKRLEWDAELTRSRPEKLIAWRSTTADVPNSGAVHFEPTPRGTRVFVVMTFGQPAGPIGALVAKVTGGDPRSMVRACLRRFKQLIEAVETAQDVQRYKPKRIGSIEEIEKVVIPRTGDMKKTSSRRRPILF
jgi:uncharacterized membrane protein